MSNFFNQFSALILPEPNSGCWFWMGEVNWCGYGRIRIGRRKVVAHRISYTMDVGSVPEGLQLDHLCRVRCCCNPQHLEPVTRSENMIRAFRHATPRPDAEYCAHGHRLSEENNYRHPRGGRIICRKCKRSAERRSFYKMNGRTGEATHA